MATLKVPSTPTDPAQAFITGLQELRLDMHQVRRIVHGTTLATNAILERRGARVGMLVTDGHRDVAEYGQLRRYDLAGRGLWDIHWGRPEPYVPRRLRFELHERVLHNGDILIPLSDAEVVAAIESLDREHVDAVAVCLLNSYANSVHEERVGTLLQAQLPGVPFSLSAETVPEYREFERWSTTILNAYVAPLLQAYLAALADYLGGQGWEGELFYMTSGGGVVTEATAARHPIRFLLSGPAAGVVAGGLVSAMLDSAPVITYDMGGTSTDVCVIRDQTPGVVYERTFAGLPVKAPQLDILTIGAGAGSVAWLGPEGGLRVGPRSAGAAPGAACYGLGGAEVTVTDANLALGRLGVDAMLGGAMHLDKDLAVRALERLGAAVGIPDTDRLAEGVVEICVQNMCGAIRTISTERGHDPRDFVLVAFGGAGPMHATAIASELGIEVVVIPLHPGNACAVGLLASDLKHDYVRTYVADLRVADLSQLRALWQEMGAEGRSALLAEGLPASDVALTYSADVRYVGQSWQLNVPTSPEAGITDLRVGFETEYKRVYGYTRAKMAAEVVNARVMVAGRVRPPFVRSVKVACDASVTPRATREVVLSGRSVGCAVYDRESVRPGSSISGPCVIEEYGSATLVLPDWRATVDAMGNLVLTRQRSDREAR